ncbi:MAG: hypothetical protein JHC22_06285 [Thermoproteus sp.]|jgi:hypothetical protein|nr:hypothetical protein [Thermoproteus sp.]
MLAGYIKVLFGDLSGVASLVPYLARILPSKRFEVKVVENNAVMDIVGMGYGIESVQVNAVAARCLLEELGYKVEKVITAPGGPQDRGLKVRYDRYRSAASSTAS